MSTLSDLSLHSFKVVLIVYFINNLGNSFGHLGLSDSITVLFGLFFEFEISNDQKLLANRFGLFVDQNKKSLDQKGHLIKLVLLKPLLDTTLNKIPLGAIL